MLRGSGDLRIESCEILEARRSSRRDNFERRFSESLRPIFVRTDRKRLIETQIGRVDGSEHEVLRRNWAAREPP
jgi:hypothetical protein